MGLAGWSILLSPGIKSLLFKTTSGTHVAARFLVLTIVLSSLDPLIMDLFRGLTCGGKGR
jgi:hypothetical protein